MNPNAAPNAFSYPGAGGINPALLASMHGGGGAAPAPAPAPAVQQPGNKFPYGGGLGGISLNPQMFQPGAGPAAGLMSFTPQQYQQLAQMKAMGMRAPGNVNMNPNMNAMQPHQQQQQSFPPGFAMGQPQPHDAQPPFFNERRPSSSASHSSAHMPQNMNPNMSMSMPPPASVPPRPPTAAPPSRPPTQSPYHGVKRKLPGAGAESPRLGMGHPGQGASVNGAPQTPRVGSAGPGPGTPANASGGVGMGMNMNMNMVPGAGGVAGGLPGEIKRQPSGAPDGMFAQKNASGPAGTSAPAPRPAANPPPALPRPVSLNPATTRVTVVPLAGSDATIPALSQAEIEKVKEWMQVDKEYEERLRGMKGRMELEVREGWVNGVREVGGVNGSVGRAAWWEKDGAPGAGGRRREKFGITYPKSGKEGRRKVGRREGMKLPRKIDPRDADRPEQLVPIRLEFDVEHHKMRDTFVWNLNDPVVTPELFAQSVVDDYALPQAYHGVITKSIQEQLSDYQAHAAGAEAAEALRGRLDGEEAAWWESWRKRLRTRGGFVRKGKRKEEGEGEGDVGRAYKLDELEVGEEGAREEMRIVIKLDIIVGSIKLDDQIEWDLNNENASPEHFAEVYGKELGLAGEFITAIAHSIREQIQTFQKSLFLVGHPSDGSAVQDDDLRMTFLPPLASAARALDQVPAFTPTLNYLDDSEIEKSEREREKEATRRRKRNTRGRRGVALPDREPLRTYRTPALGFPEVDAATLAAAAMANVPTRRAAAAAASLTIANMVASENGTIVATPQMPVSLLPSAAGREAKEKKARGLFKPPELPPAAFRPRAKVKAPTESTAMDTSLLPPPLENDPPVSTAGSGPPDSRMSVKPGKVKTARELEREAKEKEYADGQHPNFIDGVWHCSNCGCPESIAVGRRKGPLGDKTQCGQCGKFWHRHRRPRPVDYNSSAEYHRNLMEEAERAKVMARKKGGAAALRAMSTATEQDPPPSAGPSGSSSRPSRPNSVARTGGRAQLWVEVPPPQTPVTAGEGEDDSKDAISPISSGSSSASESPLAHRIRPNGVNHSNQSSTPAPRPTSTADAQGSVVSSQPPSAHPKPPSSNHNNVSTEPPEWLSAAMQAMRERYPQDRFETILKKLNPNASPEWRIKCLDCPGKLYTPGPGETLSNYEVHLKNRQHRQRVTNRVNESSTS
ncbi:SNF5-domain-containing protein [Gloeophyllum trabeum ATCC 11539]|uniref:SNF5-domain-containing protein n=1 Tax=Gloeophyllum trabeum (strain ATCC 11539 / FP-39264 / Madison 617) TaxID=670483 RepID=S7RH06_GLOTA|nr:SNF5-domain-containing protein [Gloeophyllum trabeum ATCC 11539]EPQ51859.1 SNF5-domain-containing protein [Gloeophyllum trabeum ATCC 11539]